MGLDDILSEYNRILVFGGGYYATVLIAYIEIKDYSNKIVSFTTTGTKKSETFNGYPLRPISDIHRNEVDVAIIAISPAKSEGVADFLLVEGFRGIYQIQEADRDHMLEAFCNLPLDANKILFDCYDGLGYRCNCKYVAEYILNNHIPIKMIWKVKDESDRLGIPNQIQVVKKNSKEYYFEAYTSRFIVTNVASRRLRPDQYVVWMWHGTGPFKKAGAAAFERTTENENFFREYFSGVDLFVSNSYDNTKMFRDDFFHEGEIGEWGSPRVDILFDPKRTRQKMRKRFGIPNGRRVVLYVPTFREDMDSSFEKYDLDFHDILSALRCRFGRHFFFLYRLHHLLYYSLRCKNILTEGIDVTMYEDTQELLILADVLITDYSSVMWDFSLMRKPVFLYHNDAEKYSDERGFYWPPSEWPFPRAHTTEEMCRVIEEFDDADYQRKLDEFFRRDPSYDDGHASERVVKRIMDVIENPEKYGKS